MTEASRTIQVHRVYIKAPAQAIWDAITKPEWIEKYGYQAPAEYDLRPGGEYRAFASEAMKEYGSPDLLIVGEVLEVDPPRKLVQTWHPLWSPEAEAEPATRLTHEIEEGPDGVTKLTVIHDVTGAPNVGAMVGGQIEGAGGGWAEVLSDLKSLLETGKSMHA